MPSTTRCTAANWIGRLRCFLQPLRRGVLGDGVADPDQRLAGRLRQNLDLAGPLEEVHLLPGVGDIVADHHHAVVGEHHDGDVVADDLAEPAALLGSVDEPAICQVCRRDRGTASRSG